MCFIYFINTLYTKLRPIKKDLNTSHTRAFSKKKNFNGPKLNISNFNRNENNFHQDELKQHITKILPFLFLGDWTASEDKTLLDKHNIKLIINCTDMDSHEFDGIEYIQVPVKDMLDEPIKDYFNSTYDKIDEAIEDNKGVLIHCSRGISRSTTILIAYLMRSQKTTFTETFKQVIQERSFVSPNIDFIGQLIAYEKKLGILNHTCEST